MLIYRSSRFSSLLVLLFLIPVIFQADTFLSMWLGSYPEYSVQFCILTVFCIYCEALSGPLWMTIGSDTNIRRYQIVVSSIFSLNFVGSWILLYLGFPPYGVIAIRLFISAILIFVRLIFCKQMLLSFSTLTWLKDTVLRSVAIMICPIIANISVIDYEYSNQIIEFVSVCSLSVFLTLIGIFVFGLNSGERKLILSKIRNI